MTEQQKLRDDLERIEARAHALDPLRKHWQGRPATAFMSPKSREALEGRMDRLAINFPRLLVCSSVGRINLAALSADGEPAPDAWSRHLAAGLGARAELIHTDRLMYGAAYVTVWPEADGPAVVVDNPFTMAVHRDPLTGRVSRAVRTWQHDGA